MPLKPGYVCETELLETSNHDLQSLIWHNIGSLHWKRETCASL